MTAPKLFEHLWDPRRSGPRLLDERGDVAPCTTEIRERRFYVSLEDYNQLHDRMVRLAERATDTFVVTATTAACGCCGWTSSIEWQCPRCGGWAAHRYDASEGADDSG